MSLTQYETMQAPVISSLLTDDAIEDIEGAFFQVPARHPELKPILFRRFRGEDFLRYELEEDCGNPGYSWVPPKVMCMMER